MAEVQDPIKRKSLYDYLAKNQMTDLDYDTFSREYATNPEKTNKLHSYLKANNLTDLDENTFKTEYFGDIKKKSDSKPTSPNQELVSESETVSLATQESKPPTIQLSDEEVGRTPQRTAPTGLRLPREEDFETAQAQGVAPPTSEVERRISNEYTSPTELKKAVDIFSGKEPVLRTAMLTYRDNSVENMFDFNEEDKKEYRQNIENEITENDLNIQYPHQFFSELNKPNGQPLQGSFVDNEFKAEKLEKLGVNPVDFDGFLTQKRLKETFAQQEQMGLFDGEGRGGGGQEIQLSKEVQKQRMLSLYLEEMNNRENRLRQLETDKENINRSGKNALSSSPVTIFSHDEVIGYIEEEMPLLTTVLKKRDEENKEILEKHRNGEAGFWYGTGQTLKAGWNGISDRINDLSASSYAFVGANKAAESIRMMDEENAIIRPNLRDVAYASGKKINYQGSDYIVDKRGRVIDTELKIDVTDTFTGFGQLENIRAIAKESEEEDWVFSPQGTAIQAGNVIGDMFVQIALTRGAASGLSTGQSFLAQSSRITNIGRGTSLSRIPVSRELSGAIIAQSAMGYSSGMEETLRVAREAGIPEQEAQRLASDAAQRMAVWYAMTAPLSPQTKATESIFGSEKRRLIKDAINAYTTQGKQGFVQTIKEGLKTIPRKGVVASEEGFKEVFQENVQQSGEINELNRMVNIDAGMKLLEDTMTVDDVVNTTILSFIAGATMAQMKLPSFSSSVDRLSALKKLASDDGNTNWSLDNMIKNGAITVEQSENLKKDIRTYQKHSNAIPQNLSPEVALTVMNELSEIDALVNKRNVLNPVFQQEVDQQIKEKREKIKEIQKFSLLDKKVILGLKNQAAKELESEQDQNTDYTLNDQQITERAIEIYNRNEKQQEQTEKQKTQPEAKVQEEGGEVVFSPQELALIEKEIAIIERYTQAKTESEREAILEERSSIMEEFGWEKANIALYKKDKETSQNRIKEWENEIEKLKNPSLLDRVAESKKERERRIKVREEWIEMEQNRLTEINERLNQEAETTTETTPETVEETTPESDIEQRRQEELGTKESRSYTDDSGTTWTVEIQTLADKKVVRVRGEKDGETVQDTPNTYSKELSNDKIYEAENADEYTYGDVVQVEDRGGKRTDAINAKYDAELKAVEQSLKETPQADSVGDLNIKELSKQVAPENLSRFQQLAESLQEGEMLLKDNIDAAGNKLTPEKRDGIQKSVDSTKKKILELTKPKTQQTDATTQEVTPTEKPKGTLVDNTYTSPTGENFSIEIVDGINGTVDSFESRERKDRLNLAIRDENGMMIADMGVWQKEDGSWVTNVINVNPEHRRKGIATAMYNFAKEQGVEISPSEIQTEVGKLFSQSVNPQTDETTPTTDTQTDGGVQPGTVQGEQQGQGADVQPTVEPATSPTKTEKVKVKAYKNAEFEVTTNEKGEVTKVVSSKGKEVSRFIEKENPRNKAKGKRIQENPIWNKVVAEYTGELTENQIQEETKKKEQEALSSFKPATAEDVALKAMAEGQQVDHESAKTETRLSDKEVKWATGYPFGNKTKKPSVAKLSERLHDKLNEEAKNKITQQEIYNKLIELIGSLSSRQSAVDAIVSAYDQTQESAKAEERWNYMNSLTEQERSIVEAIEGEQAFLDELTYEQKVAYYEGKIREKQQAEQAVVAEESRRNDGEQQRADRRVDESPELKEVNRQIEQAQEAVKKAQTALDNKAKKLDKSIVEDQENLFGERDSQQQEALFDERVDLAQREQATQAERQAVQDAKDRLSELREQKKRIEAGEGTTGRIDFDSKQEPAVQEEGGETTKKVDLAKDLKLDDVINTLDNFDTYLTNWGKENLGVGLPVAVAQAAVKAMKLAAQTAKTTADIVSAGINAIKDSNWYKNLNTEQAREINEGTLTSMIAQAVRDSNREAAKAQKQKQDFKNYINELKSDFADFLRFSQEKRQEAAQKLKDFETKNLLSDRTLNTLIGMLGRARTRGDFNKLAQRLDEAYREADNKEYNQTFKNLLNETKIGKYTERRQSGIKKSKITNEERITVETLHNELKKNDPDATEQARDKAINDALNNPDQAVELAAKVAGYNMAIEAMSGLEGAKNVLNEVKTRIKESRAKLQETLTEKSKQYKDRETKGVNAILGGKPKPNVFEAKEIKEKNSGVWQTIRRGFTGFLDLQEGLKMLLDRIDRGDRKGGAFSGFLDFFAQRAIDGVDAKHKRVEKTDKILQDKLAEIYGKKKVEKKLNENKKQNVLGKFKLNDGTFIVLKLSQNQAYHLYNMTKNPEAKKTFDANGWTQEMLDAIENYLTPEVKQWADWQVNEFYPMMHKDVNEVYKRMNYMDLGRPENYAPIRRTNITPVFSNEIGQYQQEAVNAEYGSLSSRTRSTAMFEITTDGDMVLEQYAEGMNHYIAYGEIIKEANAFFGNPEVQELITLYNGKGAMFALQDMYRKIANEGNAKRDMFEFLDKFRSWHTTASLAMGAVITLKQFTSTPAYMADVGVRKFVEYTSKYIANPIKYAKTVKRVFNDSSIIRNRYKEGYERDVKQAMQRKGAKRLAKRPSILGQLMINVRAGDLGAIAMGMAVYDHHYNENKKTMSEEAAHTAAVRAFENATVLSQQSALLPDLSYFQTHSSFAKLFTMYLTSPIQYMRQERKGLRDIVRGAKEGDAKRVKDGVRRFVIFHFALPMIFQGTTTAVLAALKGGFDDDDVDDMIRAAVLGNINGILLAGQIGNYTADVITGKPWARRGGAKITPAFDNAFDAAHSVGSLIREYNENPDALEDDLFYELSRQATVDALNAVGMPAQRVDKVAKAISDVSGKWDTYTNAEKAAILAGYSPYMIDAGKNAVPAELKKKLDANKRERAREHKTVNNLSNDYLRKNKTWEEIESAVEKKYDDVDRQIEILDKIDAYIEVKEVEKNADPKMLQLKGKPVNDRAEMMLYFYGDLFDGTKDDIIDKLKELRILTPAVEKEYLDLLLETEDN